MGRWKQWLVKLTVALALELSFSEYHVREPWSKMTESLKGRILTRNVLWRTGQTWWPAQRLSPEPPAAEPLRYLRHGVRLASPAWKTHSGLLWIWGDCKSTFTSLIRPNWLILRYMTDPLTTFLIFYSGLIQPCCFWPVFRINDY